MLLRMLLRHLVVLCQTVVQLEVADESQPRKEVGMVEVGSRQLSLEHFHDDNSLLFSQSLYFLDGNWVCKLLHHCPYIKLSPAIILYYEVYFFEFVCL